MLAIRAQERAGLDIITDGEMRRESYSNRFATALEGVDIDNPGTALDRSGHPNPVPRVTGKVRRKHPVEVRDVKFLRANTDRMIKMTVPGPVHDVAAGAERFLPATTRRWRSTTRPPSMPRSRTCSRPAPTWCRSTSPTCRRGPTRRASIGLKALNAALDGVTGTTAVHICFGYAAIIHVRPEGYSFLPEFANSPVQADLDRDRAVEARLRGAGEAAGQDHPARRARSLRHERSRRPETVAARIRRALPHVPAERIIVAPDCGLKYLPRDVAFGKMQAMVAGAAIVRAEIERG